MQDRLRDYSYKLRRCFLEVNDVNITRVGRALFNAYITGRSVYIFGNGGSATTASHMAVDLSKGTTSSGKRLRAISLSDNVGMITAWANDKAYASVFAEQVLALVKPGDIVIGISASGNSPNILEAIRTANELGALTVGLLGFGGGLLAGLVDISLTVQSKDYGIVEDFHLSLNHILTQYLREAIQRQRQP